MTNKEEIAKLKQELADQKAKVEALEAAQPKPQPSAEERERETREWMDRMHQAREGRMSLAMPPSAVAYFADGVTPADCADLRQQSHRPSSRPGVIPDSQTSGRPGGNVPGGGTGWCTRPRLVRLPA